MEQPISFSLLQGVLLLTILLTGLNAGLFYGYDCSVINGLGALPDNMYLQSFQSINKAILTPYFFISFIGSVFVLAVSCWLSYKSGSVISLYCLIASLIIYVIGVLGITVMGNVPLNDMLEKTDLTSISSAGLSQLRTQFETKWNKLHHIRTYAAILAFTFTIIALIKVK